MIVRKSRSVNAALKKKTPNDTAKLKIYRENDLRVSSKFFFANFFIKIKFFFLPTLLY